MKYYKECMLTLDELVSNKVVCKTIVIKKKPVILSGKIVDLNGNSISGAMIEVNKLDYKYIPCKITKLGYTISKEDGTYYICLKKQDEVDYKICIYPPLVRD